MTITELGALMTEAETADYIYNHFFGHLDDKQFRAEKTQEISDWLTDGDPGNETLAELQVMWAEYDSVAQQHETYDIYEKKIHSSFAGTGLECLIVHGGLPPYPKRKDSR